MQRYFIDDGSTTKGPYTLGQLRSMWNSGTLTGDTPYREEGPYSVSWLPLRTLSNELEPTSVATASRAADGRSARSRGIYIFLAVFLGLLGVHNFYAGRNGRGAAQFLITLILGWIVVGIVVNVIWILHEITTVTIDGDGNAMT